MLWDLNVTVQVNADKVVDKIKKIGMRGIIIDTLFFVDIWSQTTTNPNNNSIGTHEITQKRSHGLVVNLSLKFTRSSKYVTCLCNGNPFLFYVLFDAILFNQS